jgi:hypothetical protein
VNLASEEHTKELRKTLVQLWTVCNNMESLSSTIRHQNSIFSETTHLEEQAWRTCWALCQTLYDYREDDSISNTKPILELCREFCSALFDARDRGDPVKDSILRVSFELNNHLYNTRNPNLPDAFTERTLDFYITLCHRLLKDHTSLPEDTDLLLRGCWNLAECFFTFRDRTREKKPIDDETLSSAVQAVWDVSDLFRERWSITRPERGTPRPQQRSFPQTTTAYQPVTSYIPQPYTTTAYTAVPQQPTAHSRPSSRLSATDPYRGRDYLVRPLPPETPTTIFDERDDMISPGESPAPEILVYGTDGPPSRHWPSSASSTSYSDTASQRSQPTSARTARVVQARGVPGSSQTSPKSVASSSQREAAANGAAPHLSAVKALVVKAALNKGYPRTNQSAATLQAFVRSLAPTSFGVEPWQRTMLDQYKRLVLQDPVMQDGQPFPHGRRFSALEIAYAVRWIGKNENYVWLEGLYESVFGFGSEVAEGRNGGMGIQV